MVDLAGQHGRIQVELDAALLSAANAGAYIQGPEVKTFATELANYLDVAHVIPCANGTDALQIALMALGLKPGDEVITATFTYVATAEVMALLGLTPVLVDVRPDTFSLDLDQVRARLAPKPRLSYPFTSTAKPPTWRPSCSSPKTIPSLSWKIVPRPLAPPTRFRTAERPRSGP